MARIGTRYSSANWPGTTDRAILLTYVVNVDTQGNFSTTLPDTEIAQLDAMGVAPGGYNRLHKRGYFKAKSLDALTDALDALCEEAVSRELVDEVIIIRYWIATTCGYMIDPTDGAFVPNGRWAHGERWRGGNLDTHATKLEPFGLQVAAKPFVIKSYRYKSGKVRKEEEYFRMDHHADTPAKDDPQFNLKWLSEVRGMELPEDRLTQEIEYTEQNAAFFVGLLTAVFKLNETIKDHLAPDAIRAIAARGGNLLGA